MIAFVLSVTPGPTLERGWILEVLRPDDELRHGGLSKNCSLAALPQVSREPQWVRLPRRFVCKRYALRTVRREIRTGAAVAAKLYWGGALYGYWQKCPTTGREMKMHICGTHDEDTRG